MNTATISITTTPETKAEAQALAQERGMSLSKLLEDYLKRLIHTKKTFRKEEPSEYLIKSLKESEEDVKAGKVSPPFTNVKDAITWLNDPNATYANGDKVRNKI